MEVVRKVCKPYRGNRNVWPKFRNDLIDYPCHGQYFSLLILQQLGTCTTCLETYDTAKKQPQLEMASSRGQQCIPEAAVTAIRSDSGTAMLRRRPAFACTTGAAAVSCGTGDISDKELHSSTA